MTLPAEWSVMGVAALTFRAAAGAIDSACRRGAGHRVPCANRGVVAAEHPTSPGFLARTACPVCGSTSFRVRYSAPYAVDPVRTYLVDSYAEVNGRIEFEYLEGAQYTLCDCGQCGLIFQREIPNAALMERLYEHWIDPRGAFERHRRQDAASHFAEYAQDVMQLLGYIGRRPGSVSMLDFGMGWGQWATMVKAFGCDAYGAELSAERIAHARSLGITVVDWDDIPGHEFDVINADQVFEHIPDPLGTLNHLKRGLAPGGVIKIDVPRPTGIERRLRRMDWSAPRDSANSLNDVAPLEHINCFRRSALDELARRAGLRQVYIPVGVQLRNLTGLPGVRQGLTQLARPFYRSWLRKGNVVFVRQAG